MISALSGSIWAMAMAASGVEFCNRNGTAAFASGPILPIAGIACQLTSRVLARGLDQRRDGLLGDRPQVAEDRGNAIAQTV